MIPSGDLYPLMGDRLTVTIYKHEGKTEGHAVLAINTIKLSGLRHCNSPVRLRFDGGLEVGDE